MRIAYLEMQNYDLHPSQFQVIHTLERAGKSKQTDLARKAGVSSASIGTSVRRLEKIGLVRRTSDDADLRATYVELTDKGNKYARAAERYMAQLGEVKYGGMAATDIAQYKACLMKIRDNLEHYYSQLEGDKE